MTQITFSTGLWAETWRVMKLNVKNVLIYVALMTAIAVLPELLTDDDKVSGLWVAQAFAAALLAIPAHLTVLRSTAPSGGTANRTLLGFVWRGIAIGALSAIPGFALLLILRIYGDYGVAAVVGASLLLWLLVGSAAFAKWGTVLPAVITDSAKSFSQAGRRGSLTFRYAFPRLIVSLGLMTLVQVAVTFAILIAMGSSKHFFPKGGGVGISLWISLFAGVLIGAYGLIMTAVVLSRAFLMAEGKTSLDMKMGQPVLAAPVDTR